MTLNLLDLDLEFCAWPAYSDAKSLARARCTSVAWTSSVDLRSHLVRALCFETQGESTKQTKTAIYALGQIFGGLRRDSSSDTDRWDAAAAVSSCLDHGAYGVRRAAILALRRLIEPEKFPIEDIVKCTGDFKWPVRVAAIQVLGQVGDRGDLCVFEALARRLEDWTPHVRVAAVVALGGLSKMHDKRKCWVSAMAKALLDDCLGVRSAALGVLEQLAHKGDAMLISVVSAQLARGSSKVRRVAVFALGRLAATNGSVAIPELARRAADPNCHVRRAAIDGLRRFAAEGNPIALEAIHTCLQDSSRSVREVSFRAMKCVRKAQRKHQGADAFPLHQ